MTTRNTGGYNGCSIEIQSERNGVRGRSGEARAQEALWLDGRRGDGRGGERLHHGADGAWVERSELVAVDAEGKELPIVPSSFGQTIELKDKASDEEFLDHAWKSVYQLDNPDLAAAVGKDIYSFTFNYRSDASPDDGYLLAADGKAFLFDGEKLEFEYIGIAEESALDDPAEEEAPAEDDELDFSMM